jgi:hypothetical protein
MARASATRPVEVLLTGRAAPPLPPRRVSAGELQLELDGPDVRRVSYRGIEVVNQVYAAVRDGPWNTLPGRLEDERFEEGPGPSFTWRYRTRHTFPALGVDLRCEGAVIGEASGRLSVEVEVEALHQIVYNRIGLNILHGARTYAGRPYRSRLGSRESAGELPVIVGPQAVDEGRLTGLFPPFDHLELEPAEGLTVTFDLEGDEFEMEDQRNFGDATFKTYSTPLQRPAPFTLGAGGRLRQRVTIEVRDERPAEAGARAPSAPAPLTLTLGPGTGHRLPPIGLGQADDDLPLTDSERGRVAALRPHHVRVELVVATGVRACAALVAAAAAEARTLGCELWVDVLADPAQLDDLGAVVRDACAAEPPPAQLSLATTAPEPPDQGASLGALRLVREVVAASSPATGVGVGCQMFFADLNRAPFDGAVVERMTFATSPTVHRADDDTVLENVELVGDAVAAARRWLGDRPLTVGPISFATRHGPYPAGPRNDDGLPPRVDVRQVSLLAAGWTVGELASLAAAGVDGLTFFETAGPMGVTERDAGSPWPGLFPSQAGEVYPLWHVLADAASWRGAEVLETRLSPTPVFGPPVSALAVRDADGLHILVASHRREPQHVAVEGVGSAASARLRSLDASSAVSAMTDPTGFRSRGVTVAIDDGRTALELGPYATVRLDVASAEAP